MEFTKTDNLSDILFKAIDIIKSVGYSFPSIPYLDSLFTALRTINVRDVLNEILTSGDIKVTYPMYKIRLEPLITYDRNLKMTPFLLKDTPLFLLMPAIAINKEQ